MLFYLNSTAETRVQTWALLGLTDIGMKDLQDPYVVIFVFTLK